MELRDQLAAAAMQGFVSGHVAHYGHENYWDYAGLAGEAYRMADAMLAARAQSTPQPADPTASGD